MSEGFKVVNKSKPFILGFCQCNCGTEIKVKNTAWQLNRYVKGHTFKMRTGSKHWNYNDNPDYTKPYKQIWSPDHPYKDKRGYVYEHRLVMEQFLGRYLDPEEEIHHIDGNKRNNKIENLMLFSNHSEHLLYEWSLDPMRIS